MNEDDFEPEEIDEELDAALAESIAQAERGELIPAEEVLARLREL